MTPIYYDAEFTGLHRNTELISIGLVSHGGSHFYAEFTDYDKSQLNDWLNENVVSNLLFKDLDTHFYRSSLRKSSGSNPKNTFVYDIRMKNTREEVAHTVKKWLLNEQQTEDPNEQLQIYTDCYAYDWMLFNDLLCENGEALNLPNFINYIPIDLSTLMFTKGVDPDITREDFIYADDMAYIKDLQVIKSMGDKAKHNSLWDAYVAKYCYKKLFRK